MNNKVNEELNKLLKHSKHDNVCDLYSNEWAGISSKKKLSLDFIREFKNKVDWNLISKYQKLSENFIREFKDEVKWENIIKSQELSK